ncbi:MAG: TspO/MBR family protein [Oscillospiraceae bacterium]|nr:TspO/MBR family protein [Oscillospiraceae bacterium]
MKGSYYIVYPAIAVGVGALAGLITRQSVKEVFPLLEKPPLSPPAVVFPIVWTALYILMGVGLAAVKNAGGPESARAERLWWAQLAVNFSWTLVFFLAGAYLAALFVLILLFGLVVAMTAAFGKLSPPAARLQAPYLLWLAFAGYLNAGIWLLNR